MDKFQSTLPRGERHGTSVITYWKFNIISIHAPARGATFYHSSCHHSRYDFNPRSREGSDLFLDQTPFYVVTFQSTLPRGERRKRSPRRQGYHHFNPRSREGSDYIPGNTHALHALFQSTLPRGERRQESRQRRTCHRISIHAPARGATRFVLHL